MDNKSDRKLEIYYIDLKLICSIGYCIVPSHIEKKKKKPSTLDISYSTLLEDS